MLVARVTLGGQTLRLLGEGVGVTRNQPGGDQGDGVPGPGNSSKGQAVWMVIEDGDRKEGRTLGEFACYSECRGIDWRIFCRGFDFI